MFDIDKLANDLANYVKNGALTKENAEAVYEAACIKYGFDPETGEYIGESCDDDDYEESVDDIFDMTLEAALDTLDDIKGNASDKLKEIGRASEKKLNQMKFQHNLNKIKKSSQKTMDDAKKGINKASSNLDKFKKEANKKVNELKDDAEYVSDKIRDKANDLKDDVQDKIEDMKTDEGKEKLKAAAKKAAPIIAASTVAAAFVGTGAYNLLSASEKKNAKEIADLKKTVGVITNQFCDGKIPRTEFNARLDKLNKLISDGEHASVFKKVKAYMASKKTPAKYKHESSMDMINDFLYDRIMEAESVAPAEANPATHVEDEIDEKLPSETPNEPNCIGCYEDIEKTDKAIEDSKKYLDVASKLAEMKARHDAEKDTTQQHEVIDQATESTEDLINATKLNIYEACDYGIISEDEKYELLSCLED